MLTSGRGQVRAGGRGAGRLEAAVELAVQQLAGGAVAWGAWGARCGAWIGEHLLLLLLLLLLVGVLASLVLLLLLLQTG